MDKRIECIISGRVQMVMYRDYVQRKGRSLGLVGTVQNLDNGQVKATAQGEKKILQEFIKKIRTGPIMAKVESVEIEWSDELEDLYGFSIIY